MNRREFLTTCVGGAAAVAVGATVSAQVKPPEGSCVPSVHPRYLRVAAEPGETVGRFQTANQLEGPWRDKTPNEVAHLDSDGTVIVVMPFCGGYARIHLRPNIDAVDLEGMCLETRVDFAERMSEPNPLLMDLPWKEV